MTNKDNDNGLASEVSDAFGSAVCGSFLINPPSYHHQGVKMDAASKMERLYMEEIERLDNTPTPEQVDELFEALGGSFK
tara:strand:- start:100 stop:336 length:237 start_codon:yes stop_codon:yes gene_type:complete